MPDASAPIASWRRLAYAAGNAGYQLPDRIVLTVAVYFYLPPGDSGLLAPVSDRILLGILPMYGLARLLGGLVDSLADPLVGWASDRSRSRLGRRRPFLLLGVVPMCVLPATLFWPPGAPASAANFAWLTGLLALYYVFFTVYVGPYLALLPEIAPTAETRVSLATLLALVSIPVVAGYPALWPAAVEWLRGPDQDTAGAIRSVVVASSLLALALCLLPILAVDERRHVRGVVAPLSLAEALRRTLGDRPFLLYLAAQILFILGITLVPPALPYLAEAVLGRSLGFGAWLGVAYLPGAALGFLVLGPVVHRHGAKRPMLACVALLAACLASLALLRPAAVGAAGDARNLLVVFAALGLAGPAIAGFFVLPHVLIGQLIDADAARGGSNRSAMYYGVQGLLTKWVYAAALALLSFLFARFGNDRSEPLGVLLIGPIAGAFCALSALLYALYPERHLLAAARRAREAQG